MFTEKDLVNVYHYSSVKPYKGNIVTHKDDCVTICLLKENDIMGFCMYDPAVICKSITDNDSLYGCNVLNIDRNKGNITFTTDNPGTYVHEKRLHERFPVSLYSEFRVNGNKRVSAYVKNISNYGMLIYTNTEVPTGSELDIDLYLEKSVMFLRAKVIRSIQGNHFNEYGLQISYNNYKAMEAMKRYIDSIRK